MIALALVGCVPATGPLPEERREVWRGDIDGNTVVVSEVLGGERMEDGTEVHRVSVRVDAPYVVDGLPSLPPPSAPFVTCPVPHGILFETQGHWFGAWRVSGGTIAMTLDAVQGTECPTGVSFDPFEAARQAQDQRWCRLLDDAGSLRASAACVIAVDRRVDGSPWNPELKSRYQTDGRHREALAEAALEAIAHPGDKPVTALPAIGHALAATELARALAEKCSASPCDPALIDTALAIVEQGHTEPLRANVCGPGEQLAAALAADPERAARVRAVLLKDCVTP